jgi:hypothetical protein
VRAAKPELGISPGSGRRVRGHDTASKLQLDHRLRLGVGGLGSNPGWLLAPVAFVVLVILRCVNLALGTAKPETTGAEKGKVIRMVNARSILSITSETAWALGVSMLAGLPLLT